jgi:hypothetical protein
MCEAVLRALDVVGFVKLPIAAVLVSAIIDFTQAGLVPLNVSWK